MRIAGTRVHDETRRLVDDDDVLVVVDDREHDRWIGSGQRNGRQLRLVDVDLLPELQTELARQADMTVDEDSPGGHERRSIAAAGIGDKCDDSVESLAGQRRRDLLVDHAGCDPTMPEQMSDHEQHAADVDRHVGHVEDREPLQVDEVDDGAMQQAIAAEDPIGKIAERSTGDQAGGDAVPACWSCFGLVHASHSTTSRAMMPMNGPMP